MNGTTGPKKPGAKPPGELEGATNPAVDNVESTDDAEAMGPQADDSRVSQLVARRERSGEGENMRINLARNGERNGWHPIGTVGMVKGLYKGPHTYLGQFVDFKRGTMGSSERMTHKVKIVTRDGRKHYISLGAKPGKTIEVFGRYHVPDNQGALSIELLEPGEGVIIMDLPSLKKYMLSKLSINESDYIRLIDKVDEDAKNTEKGRSLADFLKRILGDASIGEGAFIVGLPDNSGKIEYFLFSWDRMVYPPQGVYKHELPKPPRRWMWGVLLLGSRGKALTPDEMARIQEPIVNQLKEENPPA